MSAAGVSWSTFLGYIPRKGDVLQEAGIGMATALAGAVETGLADADTTVYEVFRLPIQAVRKAAPGPKVPEALLLGIVSNPERMAAFLADRGLPARMDSTTVSSKRASSVARSETTIRREPWLPCSCKRGR